MDVCWEDAVREAIPIVQDLLCRGIDDNARDRHGQNYGEMGFEGPALNLR